MFYRVINALRGHLVLVFILIGFILLSSTGLFYNFGLATTVNDETPPMVAALKMIAERTLRPAYPTFYYLPVVAYAGIPFAALSLLTLFVSGVAPSADTIREFVILDYAKLLPAARFGSVCYGVFSLILFYFLAQRIFNRKHTALFATFFLSTSYLFVQLSHFGRVWGVQMLAVIVALSVILRMFDKTTLRRYLIAGGGVALFCPPCGTGRGF